MPEKIYSKSVDVVFRKIADEFILVPVRQKVADLKSIYTLNQSGAFVWELINGKNGVLDINTALAQEFDADAARIESDTKEILSQLETLGLILAA